MEEITSVRRCDFIFSNIQPFSNESWTSFISQSVVFLFTTFAVCLQTVYWIWMCIYIWYHYAVRCACYMKNYQRFNDMRHVILHTKAITIANINMTVAHDRFLWKKKIRNARRKRCHCAFVFFLCVFALCDKRSFLLKVLLHFHRWSSNWEQFYLPKWIMTILSSDSSHLKFKSQWIKYIYKNYPIIIANFAVLFSTTSIKSWHGDLERSKFKPKKA